MSERDEVKKRRAEMAALVICESLMIELSDLFVISDEDACSMIEDAAAFHLNAIRSRRQQMRNGLSLH